jgi:hypothetical protein
LPSPFVAKNLPPGVMGLAVTKNDLTPRPATTPLQLAGESAAAGPGVIEIV